MLPAQAPLIHLAKIIYLFCGFPLSFYISPKIKYERAANFNIYPLNIALSSVLSLNLNVMRKH